VTTYIHLVFSDPPAHVSEDEYDLWYNSHVHEILAVDGWIAATRYSVEGVVAPERTGLYRYLSLYELDVPPDVAIANLEAAGLGSGDSYVELKGDADVSDPLPLPDWFADIDFGSMNGTARSGRITPNP
jgi:hypothetical protein